MDTKETIATVGIAALAIAGVVGLSDEEIKSFDFNGKVIACDYTDDNTGEDLIIQTDAKTYGGFNSTEVFFSIENISDENEVINIQFHFEGDETVSEISELKKEVPRQIIVKDFGAKKYECEKWVETIDEMGQIFYECGDEQKYCDSVEGTTCTIDNALVGTHEETKYKDEFHLNDGKTNIKKGETKFFRAKVNFNPNSGGEFWIEAIGAFGGAGLLDPWYSSSYAYKKLITVQNEQVFETSSNFPVLVSVTDTNLKSTANGGNVAQADGYDIIFVDSTEGTLLDFEIESWDATTGELQAWVDTAVNSGADTTFYMYYGNSAATDVSNETGTWDANYVAVYHMDDLTTSTIDDSTTGNDGTKLSANNPVEATEKIAKGQDFSSDYITASSSGFSPDADFTLSAWVNGDNFATTPHVVLSQQNGTGLGRSLLLVNPSSYPISYLGGSASLALSTISTGTYYLITITYDHSANTVTVHINDDGGNASTETGEPATGDLVIGSSKINDQYWDGGIDELRVSDVIRSDNWIKTEYNNQNAPASFLDFGNEVQQADACFFGVNF